MGARANLARVLQAKGFWFFLSALADLLCPERVWVKERARRLIDCFAAPWTLEITEQGTPLCLASSLCCCREAVPSHL